MKGVINTGDPHQKLRLINHISTLAKGFYSVKIEKVRNKRSLNQNSYYWGVVLHEISEYTGYTKDESHEIMGYKFLLDKSLEMHRIKSTTSLNTLEFMDYIANIQRFWAEKDLTIPDPHQEYFLTDPEEQKPATV